MLAVPPGHGDEQRGEEEDEEESEQDREILRTERKRKYSSMKEVGLCGGILRDILLILRCIYQTPVSGHVKI